jgi:hypothetical protein
MDDQSLWQLLTVLFTTLIALFAKLLAIGYHWLVWIFLAAVCLWAINWKKARHVLAIGGWAPAILLILVIAIVWSRLDMRSGPAFLPLPNFWWQLTYVTGLALLAMFCGWLQTVFHWTPHEINLDPPAHGHGHDHGHGGHH